MAALAPFCALVTADEPLGALAPRGARATGS
jgi:hypothetical protein